MKKSIWCCLLFATFTVSCTKIPQWDSPSEIQLKDGTTIHCSNGIHVLYSDGFSNLPVRAVCYTSEGTITVDWKNIISLKRIIEESK